MSVRVCRTVVFSVAILILSSCSTSNACEVGNVGEPESVLLNDISFEPKKPDFGGEACLSMFLRSVGVNASQNDVFNGAGVDPMLGRGCFTRELVSAAKAFGIEPGRVWYEGDTARDANLYWNTIWEDLQAGRPTIVCRKKGGAEQFVLVVGFNRTNSKVALHDPNKIDGQFETVGLNEFLATCRLRVGETEKTSMIAVRLRGVASQPVNRAGVVRQGGKFTSADFAQHIRKLKPKLPNDNFEIVIQDPFVVVGDSGKASVERWASGTVKWAVDMIKQDYFPDDPEFVITVWLFKDKESYDKHNLQLFGEKPSTPFGYYSPRHRVLVMNIATGGGTLVHEIVHPFMASNFEECPSWFNEGLASLYEQSSSRNGRIVGLTNWRLRGLQLAIEADRLPTFKELCATTTREFYDGHSTNYAQARYLCYYLQENDLLKEYYHSFRENAKTDPTGYKTLQNVLKRSDIPKFQEQWEAYVMRLKF